MNKKIYVKPLIEITEVESTELICTSTLNYTPVNFEEFEEEDL